MEKNQIDKAYAAGAVIQDGAGASILESLNSEFVSSSSSLPSPLTTAGTNSLVIDYASALCSGYRSLSEAAINHFAGLRTDNERTVRQALQLAGLDYYERLSSILADARRLELIDTHHPIDLSLDHWHVPYQGEKMIPHYGYHWNGMMNRAFPGIHPMTAYDLTNKCFILITPPSAQDNPSDVTALDGLSLCEKKLGFAIKSVRADRGESSIEFVQGISRLEGTTYYSGVKANSILRKHVRGGGWMENDDNNGERACLRKNLDYHGVKTNLIVLSKQDHKHPSKRKIFLFITNDSSSTDSFALLQEYRMRGEHERHLGCLSALGVKHLPSTDSSEEIGGHLLLFTKLQFLFKLLCKKLGIEKKCEPKTLSNLFLRKSGMSWFDGEGRQRTIIFANRAIIKKIGRTKLVFDDGHEVILIEQWKRHQSKERRHPPLIHSCQPV
ncbi:MAG: hypothetical protein ACREFU_14090 [Acetobacteraceae bacterium]